MGVRTWGMWSIPRLPRRALQIADLASIGVKKTFRAGPDLSRFKNSKFILAQEKLLHNWGVGIQIIIVIAYMCNQVTVYFG